MASDVEPAQTRERAKDYQLESLAQMAVLGIPADRMAVTSGLSVEYVERLLTERRNKTFLRFHDKFMAERTSQATAGEFRLGSMLNKAYDGIEASLDASDIRVRSENSWRLVERMNPDPNRKGGSGGDINLTVNAPHIQTQVSNTMTAVAESLVGLRDALSNQDPNAHILLGADALPTPPSQLEVSEGEARIEPERNDPLRDLRTEIVDREEND
jgi:hypothetical protein